jgi:methionine sulfoxide reductase catalytic subunit
MLLRSRKASDVSASEITDEKLYLRRREFLRQAAVAAGALAGASLLGGCEKSPSAGAGGGDPAQPVALEAARNARYSVDEEQTSYGDATSYNNFYELGTDKSDPAANAGKLITRPWSIQVDGEVDKPGTIDFDDLIRPFALEERVYRHRCVEAWSMVIPWIGIPLGKVLERFEPNSFANFVSFRTLYDPKRMPGQNTAVLDWPYQEGLRIDEAMHPLTLLTVGMYGRILPSQNGAPLRLIVPWKYGFKGIKSIVGIRLQAAKPATSWNSLAPVEYGFYANVNPEVDHPRWSQKQERRIGDFLRRPTLPFNGYGEEVAGMYAGMNLKREF